jgi:hypothetical protein
MLIQIPSTWTPREIDKLERKGKFEDVVLPAFRDDVLDYYNAQCQSRFPEFRAPHDENPNDPIGLIGKMVSKNENNFKILWPDKDKNAWKNLNLIVGSHWIGFATEQPRPTYRIEFNYEILDENKHVESLPSYLLYHHYTIVE